VTRGNFLVGSPEKEKRKQGRKASVYHVCKRYEHVFFFHCLLCIIVKHAGSVTDLEGDEKSKHQRELRPHIHLSISVSLIANHHEAI
jgi:hypothetical protein